VMWVTASWRLQRVWVRVVHLLSSNWRLASEQSAVML